MSELEKIYKLGHHHGFVKGILIGICICSAGFILFKLLSLW